MSAPLTATQILQQRQAKVTQLYQEVLQMVSDRAASLSDPNGQTTTINLPLPPKVFTVVSWNIQTFFAGKSMGNPFVNQILNRVLEDLDVDLCMLLETREESYTNMNAIETNHVGNKKWKMVAGEEDEDANDEDEPDDPEDEDDDGTAQDDEDPLLSDQAQYGGEPLRYLQVVSDMTGKVWRPPNRVYVYDKDVSARNRGLADLHHYAIWSKKSKLNKYEKDQLGKIKKRIAKNPDFYQNLQSGNPSGKESGVAVLASSSPKLYRKFCVDESSKQPSNAWFQLLTEKALPFSLYYRLRYLDTNLDEQDWSGDLSTVAPTNYWRFFFEIGECASCGRKLGGGGCNQCDGLARTNAAYLNLRQVIDEITFYRCTCEESYSVLFRPSADVNSPSSSGVWLRDKLVSIKSAASRLLMRGPDKLTTVNGTVTHAVGDLLGFSDGHCGFRGRAPFLLPIEVWLPYHDEGKTVYSVYFHGPFGAKDNAGIRLRADAMRELLKGAVGPDGVALKDAPNSMVLGDFNLNWSPGDANPKGPEEIARQLYDDFNSVGLKPMIANGVATSLVSIFGRSKWKDITGSTTDYTSSAYDNIFLKSTDITPFVANACVIDIFEWIASRLAEFPLPADDPQKGKIEHLSTIAQAFYIYHKYVSDHLPVLIDIMVAPMSEAAKALHARNTKKSAERNALIKCGKVQQFDVVFSYASVVALDHTENPTDAYQISDETGRQGFFRGQVDSHQDGHLVIICRPDQSQQGQRLWIACVPPHRTAKQLQFLLEKIFFPGRRVELLVNEPRPENPK